MVISARPAISSESGNVMIYIFIAIALFAALSFAVANIMRSGSGNTNKEARMLEASDVIQYGDALKRAVQGMRIRSTEDHQISFESPQLPGYAPHASCSADSCRVFQAAGGGISYMAPDVGTIDPAGSADPLYGVWFFPAGVCVENAGTGGASCATDTDDNEDLVAILPWVKRDLCVQINERLGIANPAGEPPQAAGDAWPGANTKFTGTFSEDAVIARGGATSGCLRGNGTPPSTSYFYYKVLLSR